MFYKCHNAIQEWHALSEQLGVHAQGQLTGQEAVMKIECEMSSCNSLPCCHI